jgi:hypothetical protein
MNQAWTSSSKARRTIPKPTDFARWMALLALARLQAWNAVDDAIRQQFWNPACTHQRADRRTSGTQAHKRAYFGQGRLKNDTRAASRFADCLRARGQALLIIPNCDIEKTLPDLVPREFGGLAMSVMNGLYDLGDLGPTDLKKHRVLVGLCRL